MGGRRQGRPRTDRPRRGRLGASAPSSSAPASSWSPRSTATGPARASTPPCCARSRRTSACRSSPRAAPPGPDDFVAAVVEGGADAVLAASIFHRRIHSIADVKAAMAARRPSGPPRPTGRRHDRGTSFDPSAVRFAADGLVPAVVQDVARRTGSHGRVHGRRGAGRDRWRPARSTSIRDRATRLWRKGETSGNVLRLSRPRDRLRRRRAPGHGRSGRADVPPRHAELLRRRSRRAGRSTRAQGFAWLETLWATIADRAPPTGRKARTRRRSSMAGSTPSRRKVTEEATEVLLAAKDDAAAEARPGAGPGRDPRRRSPARPPTCCTTRWCCSPSGLAAGRGHRGRCGRATADAARSPARCDAPAVSATGARSRGGACRSARRATPRRRAPGRTPDR